MTASEIRDRFIKFFEKNDHTHIKSSGLVPEGDPTLLFTNAGMVQFKDYFLQRRKAPYLRAVTSQKCVRAGGKHNDLENVGFTARHHTFFEMLGNFSFGDYFKEEAIRFAWEFLTKELALDEKRLHVTVFYKDDEAYEIWKDKLNIPEQRISRLYEEDNFWSMGDLGPCGPCSEILYDQGEGIGCCKKDCVVGCDCDRYLEIWNLVFMEYEKLENGDTVPLEKKCIDTGMGLERVSAVKQGVKTNFECDLFLPIRSFLQDAALECGCDELEKVATSFRVIEDHSRAIAFLINDGVIPSNEDRGYVLRKIIRRAARHARNIGFVSPILNRSVGVVIDIMKDVFPDLVSNRDYIVSTTLSEEMRFSQTLHFGMGLLSDMIAKAKKEKRDTLSGESVFRLYDTYGFPRDITEDVARENNLGVDGAGFDAEMKKQRQSAKNSASMAMDKIPSVYIDAAASGMKTVFSGYDYIRLHRSGETFRAKACLLVVGERQAEEIAPGAAGEIVLEETVFYAEGGGQLGDTGYVEADNGARALVLGTTRVTENIIVHRVKVVSDLPLKKDSTLCQYPDIEKREATAANHTATHLLHWALKEVLGDHVKQAGSLVSNSRFRFDFSHFTAMTEDELCKVEEVVNAKIRLNDAVRTDELDIDSAIKSGAIAMFGEKYGQNVRVVSVDGYSKELCGGTHVAATGSIGYFAITSEGGISAGHRRVEGCTGIEAHNYIRNLRETLKESSGLAKCSILDLPAKIGQMLSQQKKYEKELEKLQARSANSLVDGIVAKKEDIAGFNVIVEKLESTDVKNMRVIIDRLKEKLGSGVFVLGSSAGKNGLLVGAVTDDLTQRLHAGNIIKEASIAAGGKGGGKAVFAQGGGISADKVDISLLTAKNVISSIIKA